MTTLPPSFPKGLRVLLVDDDASRLAIEAQLRQPELQYTVTCCGSSTEALSYSRAAASSFDVVLAESKMVAVDEITGRAFVDAFEDTPVVLMSEGGDAEDVMCAVKLGAVDFLDKPLSVLKLKNIWQHSVRKMMQRTTICDGPAMSGPTKSEPAPGAQPQCSLSDCLPSSMTAPIGLAPCAITSIPKSGSFLLPNRSSVDSPGTPSAGDVDPADAISAGSVRPSSDSALGGGSMFLGAFFEPSVAVDEVSAMHIGSECHADVDSAAVVVKSQAAAHPRPPLACKPSSFGPMVPVPHVSQWPVLEPGCVWGTPVGGPLPPPLSSMAPPPSAWQQPTQVPQQMQQQQYVMPPQSMSMAMPPRDPSLQVLLKRSHMSSTSLPSTAPDAVAATAAPLLPGFLSVNKAKDEGGPIGLKLRKSNSLLDMINAALSAPAPTAMHGFEARSI